MKNQAKFRKEADRIASMIKKHGVGVDSWERIRDVCDGSTNGDLDCTQLDILADMVQSRLAR